MRTVRLFVSSPGDTVDERKRVVRVVERLNATYSGVVTIEPILWEERFYSAHEGFQPQIAKSVDCDIVVAILRGRLGTPLPPDFADKIPPQEQLPDGQSYLSGTAYEILTAIEARRSGKGIPDIFVFRYPNAPSVPLDAVDRAQIEAQWQALRRFAEQVFVDAHGHFKGAYQSFLSIDDFEIKVEGALRQWLSDNVLEGRAVVWPIATKGSPFRGLEPFGAKHAEVFFGRNDARSRAIEKLKDAAEAGYPFLIVVGPSGSGKSSFARAGIAPWLAKPGAVTGVDTWRVAIMRPTDDPNGAIAGLARHFFDSAADIPDVEQGRPIALPELVQSDSATPGALAGLFSAFARGRFERPADLAAAGQAAMAPIEKALKLVAEAERKQWNSERSQSARLLLIIDQFEELFSSGFDEEARASFARLIDRMLRTGLVWIVATLRSESFDAYLKSPLARLSAPAIGEEADTAGATVSSVAQPDLVFRLLPPGLAEISEVVRGPAAAAGLEWETDPETHQRLDERLIADIDRPDLLPLVQFVLGRLFEERQTTGDKVTLTYAAYRALGRLDGAIDREAERAVGALNPTELSILPRLLRALVTYGSSAEGAGQSTPTLRSAYRQDIGYDAPSTRLVDALVQARILVSGLDSQDRQVVALAHQRVIEAWTRAKTIVAESEGVLRVRAEVQEAQRRWQESGQRRDRLIPAGLPLSEAEHAEQVLGAELPAPTRAFIDKSGSAARLRQRLTAAAAIVFLIVGGAAIWEGVRAKRSAGEAAAQRDRAELAAQHATASAQEAKQQRDRAEQQTKVALANEAEAKRQKESRDRQLVIATQSLRLGISAYRQVAYRDAQMKNYDEAIEIYERIENTVLSYENETPGDVYWPHELAIIRYERAGILANKGDQAASLQAFQQSRDALMKLVKNAPGNAEFRADLMKARVGVADKLTQLNHEQDGINELLAATAAEAALPADSAHSAVLRDAVVTADLDLGNKLFVATRNDEALRIFAEARTLLAALAVENPKDEKRVAQLANSELLSGDVLFAMKRFKEAEATYADAITTLRKAASLDVSDMAVASSEGNAQRRIGECWTALSEPDLALTAYRDVLATIADAMVKWPANKATWDQSFVNTQNAIGGILETQSKLPEALTAYQQARDRQRDIAAATPGNNDAQITLGYEDGRVGGVLLSQKLYEEAISSFRQAVGLSRSVLESNPNNKPARNDECALLESWGDTLAIEGNDDGAASIYREAIVSGTKLIALDPNDTGNQRVVAVLDGKVAELLSRKGAYDGAATTYHAALDLLEGFVPQHPEDMSGRAALAWTYGMLGGVYLVQAKWVESSAALEKSVTAEQAALRDDATAARSWPWLESFPSRLGHVAFKLELIKQFPAALTDADLALSIVPTEISIAGNRAHALMFLGRTDEARAIYLAHRGEKVGDGSWEIMVLDDFAALREAGLSNPLMDEIQTAFATKP